MNSLKFVLLAGGRGERMKSSLPKPLQRLKGKSMLERVVLAARKVSPDDIVVVESDNRVKKKAEKLGCLPVRQEEPLGTADALKKALPLVKDAKDIIVACADVPLINGETFEELYRRHKEDKNYITLVVARVDDPAGYGRVITEGSKVKRIVEEKETSKKEKKINLINGGIYCMKTRGLKEYILKIKKSPVKGEFYLTDLIVITAGEGRKNGYMTISENQIKGINRPEQLEVAEELI